MTRGYGVGIKGGWKEMPSEGVESWPPRVSGNRLDKHLPGKVGAERILLAAGVAPSERPLRLPPASCSVILLFFHQKCQPRLFPPSARVCGAGLSAQSSSFFPPFFTVAPFTRDTFVYMDTSKQKVRFEMGKNKCQFPLFILYFSVPVLSVSHEIFQHKEHPEVRITPS